MNTRTYSFDTESRIWHTPDHDSLAYSDGDAIERRLLDSLKRCGDVSVLSEELRQYIIDWPSEYHFSPQRHVLLRPFGISPSDRILELGCGCGAITRYLGETGATVVAVEGSRLRASVAAERCRDLPNVSIYCDNLADFVSPTQFDFVSLIGVLEYAPLFVSGPDPVGDCLRVARHHLSGRGSLILAIENQLGLKYLNGCREDHLGQRYFGIYDLYAGRQVITFGKRDLASRLTKAGLGAQQFLYPFPDYKLPEVILSDEGCRDPDLNTADLTLGTAGCDYGSETRRNFHEGLARKALARNELLADLANSFLVLACPQPLKVTEPAETWLAMSFSPNRRPMFATETRIVRTGDGIAVRKCRLTKCADEPGSNYAIKHQPTRTTSFLRGSIYVGELQRLLVRGGSLEEVAEWSRPWLYALFEKSLSDPAGPLLPENWLDAIPANFMQTADGNLELIDIEWISTRPVPLSWVFIRGMTNSLAACPMAPGLKELTLREVIEGSLCYLSYPIPKQHDYNLADKLEAELTLHVFGPARKVRPLLELLNEPAVYLGWRPTMEGEIEGLEQQNRWLNGELGAMLSSRSWRLTAPLRAIDQWIRRFKHSK